MNDVLRQKFCDLVAVHGPAVADDPRRCGELLRQVAPEDGAGVAALLGALEARVPARLALLTEALALAPLTSGLVRRLVDEHGLSEEAARWAVESWAVALGKGANPGAPADQFGAYQHVLAPPRRRRRRLLWYALLVLPLLAVLGGWWWVALRAEERRIDAVTSAGIYCMALSADGRTVLGGCGDQSVRVWDVDTGAEVKRFTGHEKPPHAVALSPNGRLALSCGGDFKMEPDKRIPQDCGVRVWGVEPDAEPEVIKYDVPVYCVDFSPDGRLALAGMGNFEYKDGKYVMKDEKPEPKECVVRLYDVATRKELPRVLKGHTAPVFCAVFTPDGKRVVSGSLDGTVRLWDVAGGRELRRGELGTKARPLILAVSPDGRWLLSGDDQARLRLWDLDSLEPQCEVKCPGEVIHAVAFSPDGRRAVSGGSDYVVRLWDLPDLNEVRHFPGHTSGVTDATFLPDGRHAVSASFDGTIRVWRLP